MSLFDSDVLAQLEAARESAAAHVRVTQYQAKQLDALALRHTAMHEALSFIAAGDCANGGECTDESERCEVCTARAALKADEQAAGKPPWEQGK